MDCLSRHAAPRHRARAPGVVRRRRVCRGGAKAGRRCPDRLPRRSHPHRVRARHRARRHDRRQGEDPRCRQRRSSQDPQERQGPGYVRQGHHPWPGRYALAHRHLRTQSRRRRRQRDDRPGSARPARYRRH